MKEFKPNYLLDEQMYFDAEKTLLHQIREEHKETNRLLRKVVKVLEGNHQEKKVEVEQKEEQSEKNLENDTDSQQAEKVEKKPKKAPFSEKE
jgi:hypothetical protein